MLWVSILIFSVGFVSSPNSIRAQDKKADEVVDRSQSFYQTADNISMDFTYEVKGISKRKPLERGTIMLKGFMYAVKMADQEIYFDTKKIWVYFPGRNEYMVFAENDWSYGGVMQLILSMYFTRTKKDYHGIETLQDGSRAHKVRFSMLDPKVDYSTAYAWYDEASFLVSRVTFLDRYKRQRSFNFSNLQHDQDLDIELFTFRPQDHPGIVLRK